MSLEDIKKQAPKIVVVGAAFMLVYGVKQAVDGLFNNFAPTTIMAFSILALFAYLKPQETARIVSTALKTGQAGFARLLPAKAQAATLEETQSTAAPQAAS